MIACSSNTCDCRRNSSSDCSSDYEQPMQPHPLLLHPGLYPRLHSSITCNWTCDYTRKRVDYSSSPWTHATIPSAANDPLLALYAFTTGPGEDSIVVYPSTRGRLIHTVADVVMKNMINGISASVGQLGALGYFQRRMKPAPYYIWGLEIIFCLVLRAIHNPKLLGIGKWDRICGTSLGVSLSFSQNQDFVYTSPSNRHATPAQYHTNEAGKPSSKRTKLLRQAFLIAFVEKAQYRNHA